MAQKAHKKSHKEADMETLANRMKEALYEAGMKAVDLARKTGIDKGSISNYMSGIYDPSPKNRKVIADALGVSEAWLLGYDVDKERQTEEEKKRRSDSMEAEMRDRMLEHISQIFLEADFSTQVRIYEAVRMVEYKEAKDGDQEA